VSLTDVTEFCQALAIANKFSPDEEAVWRSVCRKYSSKFSTPLHEVLEMDPEYVFTHYYEDQLEDLDAEEHIDKLLDIIYGLEDPEYEKTKKEEFDTFLEQAEAEEQERVKLGKPIHPALRGETSLKNTVKKQEDVVPESPKQGFIDLSYLEKEESGTGFEE
jgi:hypothetical protein